jgi:hypothetical protein
MKTSEKTDIALPFSPEVSQAHGEDHGVMPAEFAGMYQAGFDAGYESGKEAGYRQGFNESRAAVHQGPNGVAIKAAIAGKPAPKPGSPRMLLGMPCVRCRVYLLSHETNCPCCKQPRTA